MRRKLASFFRYLANRLDNPYHEPIVSMERPSIEMPNSINESVAYFYYDAVDVTREVDDNKRGYGIYL